MGRKMSKILVKLGLFDLTRNIVSKTRSAIDNGLFLRYYDNKKRKKFINTTDPVRYGAIILALDRIKSENIGGNIAEAGVWRGDTSKFIHEIMPDKKMYLFDTFEGFPKEEKMAKGNKDFKNTSENVVLKKLHNSKNVVIRKGYFPKTAVGLENEKFCFVMLDVDLVKSTLNGLEFFYPKMSKGGYIFIHDCVRNEDNTFRGRGILETISLFLKNKPEKIIEIPDAYHSIIIRKI
jgi:O-methyltransferase